MEWLDRLKEMKRKSGLTTMEIAEQSGIPEPTLEKLFAGVTKEPRLNTMTQLVHFFGYTLDDLVDPEKQKESTAVPEEDPSETAARAERLYNALVEAGWIPEGGDLTDEQLIMLKAAILILQDAFPESD